MKPLETNQRVLIWLCGIPPHITVSKRKRIAYIAFTLCVIVGNLLGVISGTIFIHKNVSIDLEVTFCALIHTLASANMLYQSIATVLLHRKLAATFDELANIYNESNLDIL